MDRLRGMQIFIEVVKGGGFTAAADKVGLSRAQVSKSVMQLENHLGSRLLNRTTRKVSLTETGRIYYERCRTVMQDIDEMEAMAGEQSSEPSGRLTLSAPNSFGTLYLNQAIPEYMARYPKVEIDINLTDRVVDVVSEGCDLVIRIAELEDSSLIARPIAPCNLIYCAAPDYLQQHGTPKTPQELVDHPCLLYTNNPRANQWHFSTPEGDQTIKIEGPIHSDNGELLKTAAIAGIGIAHLPTFIAGPDIQAGRLQPILVDYVPAPLSIYAVFPSRRYLSAKVRTFVDFISAYFGEVPEWDRL